MQREKSFTDRSPEERLGQTALILSGGLALVALLLLLTGCASVPPNEQRLVSKSNMVFSDNSLFNYQSPIFPQTEPGAAATGGAAAGGCSSCR